MTKPNSVADSALAIKPVAPTEKTAAIPRPRKTTPKFFRTRFNMIRSVLQAKKSDPLEA
jgi:hypothetical protein